MLPKVALIIPERKLLNLGVFLEKMKAQCLFLPPGLEGGWAGTHKAQPNTVRQRRVDASNHCSWESQQPGCGCWGKSWMEGTAKPGQALEAGGTLVLCPTGKVGVLCCAAPPLPSSLPSQPHISGCTHTAVLLQCYFLNFYYICLLNWGRRWKIGVDLVFLHW